MNSNKKQYKISRQIPSVTSGRTWSQELRRLWWLLLIPAALLLAELASRNPFFIEQAYAKKIFPIISQIGAWIFGNLPFSFAELLLYVLLALLGGWIIYTIIQLVRKKQSLKQFVHTIVTFAIIFAVGLQAFYWSWGFNHYRMPLAYTMQLDVKERPPEELATLCVSLATTANALREELPEDASGALMLDDAINHSNNAVSDGYGELGKMYPFLNRPVPKVKPVLASELMSYAGISGIFIPFTEEPNINVHQPDLLIPSSAAHEVAHYMGIAREDEANFLGYLACLHSGDPIVQYSGVMLALIHSGNALNSISKNAYSQLRGYYSEDVRADLANQNIYWEQYRGRTEETVNKINDHYLKQHKQTDGVQSYGRMVDLLLAYYQDAATQK